VREKDRSGYEIWRWLGATHGSHGAELNEANLYPTLHRMEAQHLIRAEWDEGEKTRRLYRVATRAAVLADRHGWSPIGHPMTPDPLASEQPDADDASARAVPTNVTEFAQRLDAALPLSDPCRNDVRNEIRDHLEDSCAEFERLGRKPEDAAREAMRGLGAPETLAARIAREELTQRRLVSGLGSAGASALLGAVIGIAVAGLAVLLTPIVARYLVELGATAGIHLYLPDSPAWRSQQIGLTACVAAFLAARRGTMYAAEKTRRSLQSIRPIWLATGVVPLTGIALLVPANLDFLTALAFLGIPVAFVLGTWRCQKSGDDLVSRWGAAQAAVVLLVFLFLPGIRIWYFSPSSQVAAPLPAASSNARIVVSSMTDTIRVTGAEAWSEVRIQAWPAVRNGLEVSPDTRVGSANFEIVPGNAFLVDSLPDSPADWWLVLTAAGGDGVRHTLGVAVLPGHETPQPTSILGWLAGPR
jgi:hypothetical protein